jgi:tetratricopeptide (TPR) repeat protein
MSRLDAIRKIVEQKPNDPFARYGLALELKNAGQLTEANSCFEELERRSPDYVPQYLMHGNLLAQLGLKAEAAAKLTRGIEVARLARNMHAMGEMQSALEALDSGD